MKVAIYGQFYHKNAGQYIKDILESLKETSAKVFIENSFVTLLKNEKAWDASFNAFETFSELDASFDFFFSIGGDGTILKSVTYVGDLNIPIVGINTGRLGFLATLQKENIKQYVTQILKGNYTLSERSLLAIEKSEENTKTHFLNFALNEVAINRKNTTSMIKVETLVNGKFLNNYWSDGLIIATPTGSTGYSLSCGGPLIDPTTNSLVITPIAPHNLTARPLVIPDSAEVQLTVSGRESEYLVSLDSRIETLSTNTILTVKKAPFTIQLVQLEGDSFIKTLRQKLLWGEDKRN